LRAGLGVGDVDAYKGEATLSRSAFEGDIDVDIPVAVVSDMGMLAGRLGIKKANVHSNVTRGDIHVTRGNVGYVFGTLEMSEDADFKVYTNMHYGTDDVNAKKAVGVLNVQGSEVADWNASPTNYVIVYNYRNAVSNGTETLAPDGKLSKVGDGTILTDGSAPLYTGVLDSADLKSRLLSYVLINRTTSIWDSVHVYWDNGGDGYPYVCGYWRDTYDESSLEGKGQNVYRLEIDITEIYDELTTEDIESLDGFLYDSSEVIENTTAKKEYLFAYSDSVGEFPALQKQMGALSRSIAFINNDGFVLEWSGAYDDNQGSAVFDRELTVVYETIDNSEPTAVYNELDASEIVFLGPELKKTKMLGGSEVIPQIMVENDLGTLEPYVLSNAIINCPETGLPCNRYEWSPSDNVLTNMSLLAQSMDVYSIESYSDTLRLIYSKDETLDYVFATNILTGEERSTIGVVSHGYRGGEDVRIDTATVGGISANGYMTKPVPSMFTLEVEPGFLLKSWKADFWAGFEMEETAFMDCVRGETSCNTVESAGTGNYFATSGAVMSTINKANDGVAEVPVFKWSTELSADEPLVMDSLAYGLSNTNSFGIKTALQVTPELEAVPYTALFDVNNSGYDVFITNSLQYSYTFSRESEETALLPTPLASDACFAGWALTADAGLESTYTSLNAELLKKAESDTLSMYGVWQAESEENKCIVDKSTLALSVVNTDDDTGDFGTVSLWQSYANFRSDTVVYRHEFNDGVLEIPYVSPDMLAEGAYFRFNVSSKPAQGYRLAKLQVVDVSAETEPYDVYFVPGDTAFEINASSGYELRAVFGEYVFAKLDYGEHTDIFSDSEIQDSLEVVNGAQIEFPGFVYTSDACVEGWTTDGKESSEYYHVMTQVSDELFDAVQSSGALYAKWVDAQTCIEQYRYHRAEFVGESANAAILETREDGTVYRHTFAADGTMLLPHMRAYNSSWVLDVETPEGMKLDSMVVTYASGSVITVLAGESLPEDMDDVKIEPFFSEDAGEKVDLEFSYCDFAQSGSAVRLNVGTNGLETGRAISLRLTLKDSEDEELLDSLLIDGSARDTYYADWTKRALLPGDYTVQLVLADSRDTLYFDTAFTVRSGIEIAAGSWKMISLSEVQLDSLEIDEDMLLYHWDEKAFFGHFWKYQKYTRGPVELQRGYWYNSSEGRELPLRADSVTVGDEIVWALDSGWNMVANPYGWGVWLSETEDDTLEFQKWNADAADYVGATFIEAYGAVWVYSERDREVSFTADVCFETQEYDPLDDPHRQLIEEEENRDEERFQEEARARLMKSRALAKADAGDSWALRAVLTDTKGHRDSWNVLGVGDATEMPEPPAGMGDRVNLYVVNSGRALAKSVLPAGEGDYSWQVAVSASSDRVGYLKFEGLADVAGFGYRLYVTYDGETREVAAGDSLRVSLRAEATTATVRVTRHELHIVSAGIENVRFSQQAGKISLGFSADESLAGASVVAQLVGIDGHVAATYGARASAGYNSATLEAPRHGLYMLRVRVGSRQFVKNVLVR